MADSINLNDPEWEDVSVDETERSRLTGIPLTKLPAGQWEDTVPDTSGPQWESITPPTPGGLDETGTFGNLGRGVVHSFMTGGAALVGGVDFLIPGKQRYLEQVKKNIQNRSVLYGLDADESVVHKGAWWVGDIGGQLAQFFTPAKAVSLAGLGMKAATVAPMAMAWIESGDQAYDRAKEQGASDYTANMERLLIGSADAALTGVQVGKILDFTHLNQEARSRLLNLVSKHAWRAAAKQGGSISFDALKMGLINGLTEAAQTGIEIGVPAATRGIYPSKEDGTPDFGSMFGSLATSLAAGTAVGIGAAGVEMATHIGPPIKLTGHTDGMNLHDAEMQVRLSRKTTELNEKEIFDAQKMAERLDMPFEDALKFARAYKTTKVAQPPLSDNELAEVMRLHVGKENVDAIMGGIYDPRATHDALTWLYNHGGLPSNPDFAAQAAETLRDVAFRRQQQLNRIDKMSRRGKEANLLSQHNAMRYVWEDLEIASGRPTVAKAERLSAEAGQAADRVGPELGAMYMRAGIPEHSFTITPDQNVMLRRYLFSGDPKLFQLLEPHVQKMANELQLWLQNEGADSIRYSRWHMWKDLGIEPPDLKKLPANERDLIMAAGDAAAAKGDSELRKWLHNQDWGARKDYYMTEHPDEGIDDLLGHLEPDFAATRQAPGPTPYAGAAHTRKGPAKWKDGLVVEGIASHMRRLYKMEVMVKQLPALWDDVKAANLSHTDTLNMKAWLDNILDRNIDQRLVPKLIKGARGAFWKWGYFANPIRGAWYSARNWLQESLITTQMGPMGIARGLSHIQTDITPEEHAYMRNYFDKFVSQKHKLWQQSIMMDEVDPQLGPRLRDKISYGVSQMGQLFANDDPIRRAAFRTYYGAAKNLFEVYGAGKMPWNTVRQQLMLDSLLPSQQRRILDLLDKGQVTKAQAEFAGYKTENTHFRYETAQRSFLEQEVGHRAIAGLMTYPHGLIDILVKNGWRPMLEGLRDNNYNKYSSGFKTVAGFMLAAYITQGATKEIFGKISPLFDFQMLDPGIGILADTGNQIGQVMRKATREDWPVEKTAGELVGVFGGQAEFLVPVADSMLNLYEGINDKAGVRLWTLVKNEALKEAGATYRIVGKNVERTAYQKTIHMLFGGFEEPKEAQE